LQGFFQDVIGERISKKPPCGRIQSPSEFGDLVGQGILFLKRREIFCLGSEVIWRRGKPRWLPPTERTGLRPVPVAGCDNTLRSYTVLFAPLHSRGLMLLAAAVRPLGIIRAVGYFVIFHELPEGGAMNKHTLGFVIVMASTWPVLGADKDAAYFCTGEAAGGIYFNTYSNRWEGTVFRGDSKFVLRMKFIRDTEKVTTGVSEYLATITNVGESVGMPCFQSTSADLHVDVYRGGTFFMCQNFTISYRFNLKTNRFLKFYEEGYVDGKDNNDDTPAVTGGRCTKID
jgi:hypothetical protein